jgi:hypothetical protein
MNNLIYLIIIILLAIIFVGNNKSKDLELMSNKSDMILGFLVVVAIVVFFTVIDTSESFNNMSQLAPLNHSMGACDSRTIRTYPNNYDYDGQIIEQDETDYKLVRNFKRVAPDGEETEFDYNPESLFMLENNYSSPKCCPSTFSDSRGCVCMTNNQRQRINSRGGNKAPNGNPDI